MDHSEPFPGPLWVAVPDAPDGVDAFIRVVRQRGRWAVSELHVDGDQITPSTLQRIRFGDLSQQANLLSWQLQHGRGATPTFGDLPAIEADQLPPADERRDLAERSRWVRRRAAEREADRSGPVRQPLSRPDGSDPDRFYRLVAAAYRDFALRGHAPGTEIAEEAAVPIGTARSWIREARRRGFLPPGRRGGAG